MDKNPQYFEATLQLRNPSAEGLRFFKNQLKKNPNVWIAKEEKLKNGFDYLISSNKFTLNLGKKLNKSFKGELKVSRRLYGQDRLTSRLLYRATVFFKFD